jgi:cytochrome c556
MRHIAPIDRAARISTVELSMFKVRGSRVAGIASGLVLSAGLTTSCSSPKTVAPAAAAPALWGDMKPVVSVKELMRDMIDPIADNIFDSIAIVDTPHGTAQRVPKTDEDWDKIRIGAVTLAEGAYLLKVQRPFAPAGDDKTKSPVEGEELAPAQIQAKVEKDPVLWNAKIEALRNVGLEVMEIVRTRKVDELWDASDNLDAACESCHVQFWYPGEGKFLKGLDNKLEDLFGRGVSRPDRSRGR